MLFCCATAAVALPHISSEQRRYVRRVNTAVVEGEIGDEEVGASTTRQSHRQLHVNVICTLTAY